MTLTLQAVQDHLGVWIPQIQGKYINEDWNPENEGFGAQCWDLAANWSKRLGLPVINTGYTNGKWVGWAGNMVSAYPQTPEIESAYELIAPDQPGLPGDIPVWGDSYKEYYPATHVAVLIRDPGGLQLLCASQNSTSSRMDNPYPKWSSGPATIQYLPRRGLIGFLRPRTGLSYQGTITPSTPEEDELSKAAEEQIARIHQILEAQETDRIRERIIAIDDRTAVAGTKYLKGDQEATLYSFEDGKLRGINLVEWQATGQGYRILPQDIINALPRA